MKYVKKWKNTDVTLACALLLGSACSSWGFSKKNSKHFSAKHPDTYFKIGSTYVGINTIATGLDEPWEITWGPDGWIWMAEHGGTVSKINPKTGKKIVLLKLSNIFVGTTPGLLGMAISPDQEKFPHVFLMYNSKNHENKIVLNLVRYTVHNDTLANPKKLLETPSARHHVGSRIKISPNGKKLLITDGDAENGQNAQNVHSLNGKVLRLNIDGSIPGDNPFPGSPVWAWGFRAQEGLTFGKNGILYDSMNGPASDDEVNIIKKGSNYGWPEVNGYCNQPDEKKFCAKHSVKEPLKAWTPTIAPAGLTYYKSSQIPEWRNSLLLATLKDASLHVLSLNLSGTSIKAEHVFLKNIYGRLRDVCVSPRGDIYISTSNRDWNPGQGYPKPNDDRIIRLSKVNDIKRLKDVPSIHEMESGATQAAQGNLSQGTAIYKNYCTSCHKANGKGVKGNFPPLSNSKIVNGNGKKLISIILNGDTRRVQVNGVEYHGHMPSFKFLSDKKVSQLLTYLRSHFSNNASKVSDVLVKHVRSREAGTQ